jgi:hypothetical protein
MKSPFLWRGQSEVKFNLTVKIQTNMSIGSRPMQRESDLCEHIFVSPFRWRGEEKVKFNLTVKIQTNMHIQSWPMHGESEQIESEWKGWKVSIVFRSLALPLSVCWYIMISQFVWCSVFLSFILSLIIIETANLRLHSYFPMYDKIGFHLDAILN